MRIVLIGSVDSSELTLRKLVAHGLDLVGVFGYEAPNTDQVSGYVNLGEASRQAKVPYTAFRNINEHVNDIRHHQPDMIFVVGLSQLIAPQIIALASQGCVGFHPTALPEGRGRAPVPWMILEQRSGAATFFRIAEGVDDGPVYVQKHFEVTEADDAGKVVAKVAAAMAEALDEWLPRLARGDLSVVPQDEGRATYLGRRSKEDGLIEWSNNAAALERLIKATSRPYPGAYTFERDSKLIIWRASLIVESNVKGVCGRILEIDTNGDFLVQCGTSCLKVTEFETEDSDWQPRPGLRLGYYPEWEICQLRRQVTALSQRLQVVESYVSDIDINADSH